MKENDATLNFLEDFFKNASKNVKPIDDTNVSVFLKKLLLMLSCYMMDIQQYEDLKWINI